MGTQIDAEDSGLVQRFLTRMDYIEHGLIDAMSSRIDEMYGMFTGEVAALRSMIPDNISLEPSAPPMTEQTQQILDDMRSADPAGGGSSSQLA